MLARNGLGPLSMRSVSMVCPVSRNSPCSTDCSNFFVVDLPVAVSPKKKKMQGLVVPQRQLASTFS
nr:MAG: hypothetical protein [Molluscum contagiosum virus]